MGIDHITPTRARELLERHGLAAHKAMGQHFLVDPNTVRRIVRLAELDPTDTVLEIGPGLGSLTVALVEAAGNVVAVELDEGLAAALGEVVGDAGNIEVVVGDALDVDLSVPGGTVLVSNLPYNVATPVLARVLDEMPEVRRGLVMVQRELADRWCARPGSKTYGSISVKVRYHAQAQVVGAVPPSVFWPPPKVESALVRFARRAEPPVDVDDHRAFTDFVAAVFGHRRKTLRNALRTGGYEADGPLERSGIDPSARPEELDIESFARLYREIA